MFLYRSFSVHVFRILIPITRGMDQLERAVLRNGHTISLALSGINKMKKCYWGCSKLLLCCWPCLVGFLWGFFLYWCRHWFMLTCDPQLPISFLQASSVANWFFVFVLFITCMEMLIFVLLFTKLHPLESYWILIQWFLAVSLPQLGIVCRSVKRSTDCSQCSGYL